MATTTKRPPADPWGRESTTSRANSRSGRRILRRLFRIQSWRFAPLTLCTLCTTLKEMSTAYVSGRVPARYERLVAKQARAAKTSKSDLVARYVIEKSLETEFPGISFRDSLSGREAYLTGHRVAVWEVLSVHDETKSVDKTAEHFHWPRALVKRALAYAKAFPEEVSSSREGETDAVPAAG